MQLFVLVEGFIFSFLNWRFMVKKIQNLSDFSKPLWQNSTVSNLIVNRFCFCVIKMDPHLTWLLTHIHKFSLSTCQWRKWVVSCLFQWCWLAEWSLQLFIVPQLLLFCWDTHRNRHTPPETLGFCSSLTSSSHFNTCDCCLCHFILTPWAMGLFLPLAPVPLPSQLTGLSGFWLLDTEYWWCVGLLSARVNTFCVGCWSLPEKSTWVTFTLW